MGSRNPALDEWKLVVHEWNRIQGPYLQVRDCDVLWNLTQQPLVQYRFARLANTPVLYGIASDEGLASGLSGSSLWLSLWGEIAAGAEDGFINELLDLVRREKKSRCSIGADEFHFVPGLPMESDLNKRLLDSLVRHDFKIVESCDLIGELESEAVSRYIDEAASRAESEGWQLLPASSPEEKEELRRYLAIEFPGRWTREFEYFLRYEDAKRAIWYLLRAPNRWTVGFARIAVRSRYQPLDEGWTPGALRLPLHTAPASGWSANDGCLGPIGVSSSQRGKGTGRLLLGLVLRSLRVNGAKRACIDWTDAMKYYSPLQFKIARRFGSASKTVAP